LQKLAIQLPDTTKLKNAIMQMNYSFETKQIQTINQEYYKLYIASVTQFANEKLPGAKIPEIAPNLDERSLYFLTKLYEKLYKAIKTNDVQTAAQLKHELLWAEQNAAKMKFLVGYYAKHAEPPFLKNTNKTDVSADVLQTLQYLLDNANNEVANFNCDADIKEGKENIKTIFNYLQSVNEVKKNTIESLCLADEYLNDKYNIERIALLIAAKNNGLNVDLIPKPSAAPAAEEQNLFLLFAEGDAPFNDNEIYKKFKTLLQAFATAKDPDKTALKDLLNKLSNFTDIAASGLAVVPAAITNEDAINSTFVLAFQTLGATNAVKYDANNHYNSLEVHNLLKTLAKGEISNDEKTAISSLLANALPPANENQNGRFPARCYLAESGLDINKNLKKCGVVGASHLINIEGLLNKVAAPNERPNLSGIINENILGGADVLGACNNFKNAIAQFANLTSIKDKTLLTTSLAKDLKEIVSVLNLDNDGQINNNPNDKNNPDCNKNAYEKETQIQLLKLLKEINASNLSDEAKLALIKKLATALKIRKAIPQLFLGADGSSIAGMSGIFNAAAGGTTDQSYNLIDIFRQWSPSHFEAAKNAIEKQEKNEDGSLKFDTDNNTAEIERTKIRAILANKSLGADGAIGVPINPDELNNEKNNTAKNFANNLANRLAKVLPAIFTADITANVAAADGAVVSGHCDNVLNQNRINGIAFDFANYKEVSQAKLDYLKLFDKHIDVIKGLPEDVEKAILGQALSVFKTPLDNPDFNVRKIKDLEAKMLLAVSEIATTEIEIISGHNLPNPAVNQNKESGNHLNGVFPLINTAITAALFLPLPRCLNDRKALDETKTNEFYKKLTRIALQTKGINDLKQQIQAIWGEIKARTKDGNNLGEKFVNTISNEKRIEIETKLDHIEKEALTKIATNALGDNDIYNAIASSEKETIKTEYNKKTEIIKAFKDDLEMQEQLQTFGAELARIEELDIPKEEMESAKWLAFRNNVNKLEEIACKIYIAKATKVAFNNISPLTKNGIKIATALFEKKNSQLLTKFAKNTLTEIANGKITTIHPWEIEEPSIAATNGQYESILEKIAELQPATQQKLKEFLQLPIFDQLTINENDTELSPKILKAAKEFLKENKTDSSFDFNDLSIANFKEKIKDYGMATLKDKLGTGDAIKTIQNKLKQQPLTNKEKLEIYSSIAYIDQAIVNITDAHVSEEFKNIFKNELAKQNPFSASFDAKNIEKTCEKLLKELSLDERLDKKATKEELEKLKKDNSEEIEKLKEEIEKLKTLDGDKSEEIDKLKQKIEDLEKNTNKKEDIDKLKQKIEDLEKNTNKKEDIDKLKAEIENRFKSFEEKIQSIKEEISNIEKDIKNKEGEEKRLQQEIADLEAKINDPNTSEAEKEAAKRELEQRKERFNTLQEEIDKLKQKKEDLGSNLTELTNLKKEIAELKNNTNNLKNEINNLKKGQNKASPASEDKTEYEVKNVEQQIEIPEKETSNAPEAIGIITGLSMVVVGSLMASSVIAIGTAGLALGITIVAVGAFAMLASVVKVIENSNKDNIKLKINVPSIKQKTQNKDNTKTQAKSTQTAGQGKITNLNTLNASQKTPQIIS
jgi:predicted  nucleic acid-binding Zn-ribbon protein